MTCGVPRGATMVGNPCAGEIKSESAVTILVSPNVAGKEPPMNKTELIAHIADEADISQAAAARALASAIDAVKTTLCKGDAVTLVGFGTFAVSQRRGRTGRNPRTGAAINIVAAKVPKFRPGKALKDALN